MLSCITHMTILSVLICVMNVRNQTSQAFVTIPCTCLRTKERQVYQFVPNTSNRLLQCHLGARLVLVFLVF